jgi:hypothetical protein
MAQSVSKMRVSGSGTDETGADELRGVEAGRI